MLVAATGTLRNPDEVLTATQRARLAQARTSATDRRDPRHGRDGRPRVAAGRRPVGTLTWRFTADSVRDFAWAAVAHFVWDAVGVNGGKTLAMSFYPPSAEPLWNRGHAVRQVRARELLGAVGALSLPHGEQRATGSRAGWSTR